MKKFMAKKRNSRFFKLVKDAKNDMLRDYRLNEIVNQIYNEYRNKCYSRKIKLGEQLDESR